MSRIEELEAKLAQLRQEEADRARALRESVTPRYTYMLVPHSESWDKIADPSCRWYRLEGVIINTPELNAVGAAIPAAGGMNYLFNTLSGRFVISGGGGTVYLNLNGRFGPPDTEAFQELEAFVAEHPEGGDVTEIVERGRARREG